MLYISFYYILEYFDKIKIHFNIELFKFRQRIISNAMKVRISSFFFLVLLFKNSYIKTILFTTIVLRSSTKPCGFTHTKMVVEG